MKHTEESALALLKVKGVKVVGKKLCIKPALDECTLGNGSLGAVDYLVRYKNYVIDRITE